jgi:hypothetical protein
MENDALIAKEGNTKFTSRCWKICNWTD